MAVFLSENTLFACANCEGGIYKAKMPLARAEWRNSGVLTSFAFIQQQAPGPCKILTQLANGVPTPCPMAVLSAVTWTGGDPKVSSGGGRLLTKDARGTAPCAAGGASFSVRQVLDNNSTFLQGKTSLASANQAGQTVEHGPAKSTISAKKTEAGKPESQKNAHTSSTSETVRKEQPKLEALTAEPFVELKCDACKEENCPDRKQLSCAINNDSALLWENYENAISWSRKTYALQLAAGQAGDLPKYNHPVVRAHANALDAMAKFSQKGAKGWTWPAHHVISGNLIVKANPDLAALVNIFDYDINGFQNCIILIGAEYGVGFGGKAATEKHWTAFNAMTHARLQWHMGSHDGKISKEENQLENIKNMIRLRVKDERSKTPNFPEVLTYAELLRAEVEKIVEPYRRRKICPRKEKQRSPTFNQKMDALAEKVRLRLAKFAEKAHRSWPWYVSKEAYLYAFDLPRQAKIIAVRQKGDVWLLEKFRITRYNDSIGSSEQLAIKQTTTGEAKFSFISAKTDRLALINFCSNILYFVLLDDVDMQPLHLVKRHDLRLAANGLPTLDLLKSHQTELLVWLWEASAYEESSPVNVMTERLAQ